MKFEWDTNKKRTNIHVHGIDFNDVHRVFDEPMLVKIDGRKEYGEERLVGLGQLEKVPVVVIFTKRGENIRIISIRRANRNERKVYEETFKKPD